MVRRIAVDVLEKMHQRGVLAQDAIASAVHAAPLPPEDRGFLSELVLGVTRHRATIDRILVVCAGVKMRKVHPRVLQALRIAVYQTVYLDRVPDSAAVNESVEIVKERLPAWAVRFTNGCLRSVSRAVGLKVGGALDDDDLRRAVPISGFRNCLLEKPVFPDPREDLAGSMALRHGHPLWLVRRWLALHGPETTRDILRAGNEAPTLWLRPTRGHLPDMVREMGKREIRHEVHEEAPPAIRILEPSGPIHELPGYRHGWFTVQDRTAMRASLLLDPRPGERILDLCAAPGGKSAHIADLAGPDAEIVALDQSERRIGKIIETARRLGIANIATVVADARDAAVDLGGEFDRILADVPCSNTGVLGKRVEARHRVTPEGVGDLVLIQASILDAAAARLRSGGVLVYSTCAVLPEENRGAVDRLLARRGDLRLDEDHETLPSAGWCDGGYIARLTRVG